MDQAQATAALQTIADGMGALGAELTKGLGEVTAKLGELTAGGTTPAQDALIKEIGDKLAAVQGVALQLDALVPDVPPPAPAPPPAP